MLPELADFSLELLLIEIHMFDVCSILVTTIFGECFLHFLAQIPQHGSVCSFRLPAQPALSCQPPFEDFPEMIVITMKQEYRKTEQITPLKFKMKKRPLKNYSLPPGVL